MAKERYRVGAAITALKVRVLAEHGDIGVLDIADALRVGAENGVVLVEVAPFMNPPVCRFVKPEEVEKILRALERC